MSREYPAPFMKKDSFKSLREGFQKEASRAELQPIDEDELQRKELERLLGTAVDEDRKDMIQKAINALDASGASAGGGAGIVPTHQASNFIQSLHPNAHAQLFSKVPVDTVRGRPVSAQKRRPSNTGLLGSIPENRSIVHDKTVEIELMQDDIADISGSSYDPRFPPRNLFQRGRTSAAAANGSASSSSSGAGGSSSSTNSPPKVNGTKTPRFWVPTGLSPQFLYIQMHMSWNIKKIEIKCVNVDEVTARIEGGLDLGKRSVINSNLHFIDDKLFVFNAQTDVEGQEVTGNKILLTFRGSSSDFIIVHSVHIRVLPTG